MRRLLKDREYIKEKSEKMRTKKTVFAALFAALTCVMTMLIKVPSPLKGYLNLGDSAVLVSGWFLGLHTALPPLRLARRLRICLAAMRFMCLQPLL